MHSEIICFFWISIDLTQRSGEERLPRVDYKVSARSISQQKQTKRMNSP